MKNLIILSAIVLGLFCVSCSDHEEKSTEEKAQSIQTYHGQSQNHSEHLSTPLELDSLLWTSFEKQDRDVSSKLRDEMTEWMSKEKASFERGKSKEASLSTNRQSVLADKNLFSEKLPFSL
ncbi:hypothetical protein [Salibacter halophilus]|uniref:Uncharacterized protein n=1 Tax=Salibacter halophilus TaxID=1803916 RepID=A0A6N6M7G1_9FLAO|nr:hypothetical protein [Salibacter halophilus]KAB1064006.1 hypothetical protein F3059_08195 [Salibacter halophilus]